MSLPGAPEEKGPETVEFGAGSPMPVEEHGKSKKGVAIIAAVSVLAVTGIVGGAMAFSALSSSDDYPYNHLANGAVFYAQTNVDPSASQKMAINDLAKKFPELKEEGNLDLTADNLNGELLKSMFESEDDWTWAGDRMAVAAYPDGDDEDTEPEIAVLVQAKDEASAEKGLDQMLEELNKADDSDYTADSYSEDTDPNIYPEEEGAMEGDLNNDMMIPEDEMTPEQLQQRQMDMMNSPEYQALMKELEGAQTNEEYMRLMEELEAMQNGTTPGTGGVTIEQMSYSTDVEVSEEPEAEGKVLEGGWVAVTSDSVDKMFPAEGETLAGNETFTDQIEDIEGNVFAAWGDFGGFSDLAQGEMESSGSGVDADVPLVEGEGIATVEFREDGIDFKANTFGVTINGEAYEAAGDTGETQKLVDENSYEDSIITMGVTGLGETVRKAAENQDVSGQDFGVDEDVTVEDLPGLLGSSMALSLSGENFDEANLAVALSGIDGSLWEKLMADEGTTPEDLEAELTNEFSGAEFTLEDDSARLVIGDAPEGGMNLEEGATSGKLDMDKAAVFINSIAFFGEQPEAYDGPKDMGTIEWEVDVEDEGDSSIEVGWTTRR